MPEVYFCPYCGQPSALDQWYTDEQVDYIQAVGAIETMKIVEKELGPTVDKFNRTGQTGVAGMKFELELDIPQSTPPTPLFEADDMMAVEPPCHPEEPIKIHEDWLQELHCLVCGDPFVIERE